MSLNVRVIFFQNLMGEDLRKNVSNTTLQRTDHDLCRFIMFQTPTIHGIEFTWEKVKKKLDLDGCGPLNATGKVMIFHTDLGQSKTK